MSRRDGFALVFVSLMIAACSKSATPPGGGNGAPGGGGAPGGTGGAGGATTAALLTVVSARFPAADAIGICSDAPLRLSFTVPVAVGAAGKIQVWKASAPDAPVDTVDVGATMFLDAIGNAVGARQFAKNRPVFIDGTQAIIYLHRLTMLAPNETYYVTVDAGVFVDAQGASLGAITSPTDWRFTTRAPTPASPDRLVVALDNSGDFCTVQSAVDFIPAANTAPVTINIMNGTYREIVFINTKHNITVHGQDRKNTIIAYANNNTLQAPQGTAFRAMVEVEKSNGLVIENITLHNTTPQNGSQAEALRIEPGDQIILRDSDFISLQDTLLISGRAYVTNCYIEGNVDYIWGKGTVYFDKCEIKTVGRKGYNVQSRNTATNYGYVFVDSKLTADPAITGHFLGRIDGMVYPASHVAYIDCQMGNQMDPTGWLITPAGVDTSAIRFWEYHSVDPTGAPIDVSMRLPASRQLTDDEAAMMRDKTTVFTTPGLPAWNPTP